MNLDIARKHIVHREEEGSDPFFFVQAADSQFGLIDRYLKNKPEPGWAEETELCERLVAACNQLRPRPKFLIVCGDLIDAELNGDQGNKVREDQKAEFNRIFAKVDRDIPVLCVCGNHDVGNVPTMDSIQDYRASFGDDYYYFVIHGVLFIVINSQFYEDRTQVQEYAKEHDQWLESLLTKCKLFRYTIIFEHIPWFLEDPNEEDQYFNINKNIRLDWLAKFKRAGVNKIMCGHYHKNAGGWYEDMELVVTTAIGAQLGTDKSGARIVKVLDKGIEHHYYATDDLPREIDLN